MLPNVSAYCGNAERTVKQWLTTDPFRSEGPAATSANIFCLMSSSIGRRNMVVRGNASPAKWLKKDPNRSFPPLA
jgi:hypothetical protein